MPVIKKSHLGKFYFSALVVVIVAFALSYQNCGEGFLATKNMNSQSLSALGPEVKEAGFVGGFVAATPLRLPGSSTLSGAVPSGYKEGNLWMTISDSGPEAFRILHFDMSVGNLTPHIPVKEINVTVPNTNNGIFSKVVLKYYKQNLYLLNEPIKTVYAINLVNGTVRSPFIIAPDLGTKLDNADIHSDYLFISSSDLSIKKNIKIFSLTNPTSVSFSLPAGGFRIEENKLLHFSPDEMTLGVYDLSAPSNPNLIQTLPAPQGFNRIYSYFTHISSDYLVVHIQSPTLGSKTQIFRFTQGQYLPLGTIDGFGCDTIYGDYFAGLGTIGSQSGLVLHQVDRSNQYSLKAPQMLLPNNGGLLTETIDGVAYFNNIGGKLYAIDLRRPIPSAKLIVNTSSGNSEGLSFFDILGDRVIVDLGEPSRGFTLVFGGNQKVDSRGPIFCEPTIPNQEDLKCLEVLKSGYRGYFDNALAYTPKYPLYSDGAEKQRIIYLPPGKKIDTTDTDNWTFPRETRLWKEFIFNNANYETRVFEKIRDGVGSTNWISTVFAPSPNSPGRLVKRDPADRTILRNQLTQNKSVAHVGICIICHNAAKDYVLGFNALQLSGQVGTFSLANLGARGLLTRPILNPVEIQGSPNAKAALGYMQTNCGTCHSPTGPAAVVGLNL